MAEPWSVEAEARQLCACWYCMTDGSRASACHWREIARGIRAGLTRAAGACTERANAIAENRRMSDYQQGAYDEAENCRHAIEGLAKTKG